MKVILAAALTCLPLVAGSVTFTLSPVGGEISGSPGDTVGWGFTLDNETGDYLYVNYAEFVSGTALGTPGDNSVDYSEAAGELGPSPYSTAYTATGFDNATMGIGFLIDPSAVVGASWAGQVVLQYELYSTDPSIDGGMGDLGPFTASADAQIDIVAPESSVPEPAVGWAAGVLGLAACGWAARFARLQARRRK
jgi:hypothetical protein